MNGGLPDTHIPMTSRLKSTYTCSCLKNQIWMYNNKCVDSSIKKTKSDSYPCGYVQVKVGIQMVNPLSHIFFTHKPVLYFPNCS